MNKKQLKFYVDFDDILCETANIICKIASEKYGSTARFEDIKDFNLQKSLNISQMQYEELMHICHSDEILQLYKPINGAQKAINSFVSNGAVVDIVTGRPPHTLEASKAWLQKYGFMYNTIRFVDKYGRCSDDEKQLAWSLDDVRNSDYDIIIDDAPIMLQFVVDNMNVPVGVLQRPWNKTWLHNQNNSNTKIVTGNVWQSLQIQICDFFSITI